MEYIGFVLMFGMGLMLGLVGGGGSMLALPVLVYVMNVSPVVATAYSLFLVGITAATGAAVQGSKQNVDFKAALLFAMPSIPVVYLVRRFLLPAIPLEIGGIEKDTLLMIFFALLMLLAGFLMLFRKCEYCDKQIGRNNIEVRNYGVIILEGLLVGTVTGLVGAGGGFLVVPALVIYANLPMRIAVGTSLLIIALKSAVGFIGDLEILTFIDWPLLFISSSLALAGMMVGARWNSRFREKTLKKFFGWNMLVLAGVILVYELYRIAGY